MPMVVLTQPTTTFWSAFAMTAIASPLWQQQVSPESKKPYTKFGGNKSVAFMQSSRPT
jgi:hypothetical protein